MSFTTLSIDAPDGPADPLNQRRFAFRTKLQKLGALTNRLLSGGTRVKATMRYGKLRAAGTIACSSTSGSPGATINGVSVTVTSASDDQVDCSAIVAAINASSNALVTDLVQASNYAATITCASVAQGDVCSIAGIVFTATGGTGTATEENQFTLGGNDTQDAATLVTAINAHPVVGELVRASNSSGVVTIRAFRALPDNLSVTGTATRLAASGNLAATTTLQISALWKGTTGNCVTLAAAGTGTTASGTRLTGGTNGTNQTL